MTEVALAPRHLDGRNPDGRDIEKHAKEALGPPEAFFHFSILISRLPLDRMVFRSDGFSLDVAPF